MAFSPGNYSTKVLEQLGSLKLIGSRDRHNLSSLLSTIRRSVHFGLPDCGNILPRKNATPHVLDFDTLQPPFDDVVLEYSAIHGRPAQDGQLNSSKRIVVCTKSFDLGFEAVSLIPITYADHKKEWILPAIAVVFPLEPVGLSLTRYGEVGFRMMPLFPDSFPRLTNFMSEEDLAQDLLNDAMDEINAYMDFVVALSLTNFEVADVKQPRTLNAARVSRKKARLFDYKVLNLKAGKSSTSPADSLYELRGSPRSHLRRGHIRNIAAGKRTWVRPAFVNGSGEGFVHKSYNVQKQTPAT